MTAQPQNPDASILSRKCARPTCVARFQWDSFARGSEKRYCSKACSNAARHKRWRLRYPDKAAKQSLRSTAAITTRRRGITAEEFERRIAAQDNRCPIGNHEFVGRGLGKHAPARDHCHITGWDRAILCSEHNRALGMFHDSPEEMQAAITYVLEWRQKHAEGS